MPVTLTLKRIERLTSAAQGQLGHHRDPEVAGLYLQVARLAEKDRRASASWILRYQFRGKERQMGLGSLHDISLEEARDLGRAARKKLAARIDPLDERDTAEREAKAKAAKKVTFEAAAIECHGERLGKEAKITSDQFISSLRRYAFAVIGSTPVSEIDRTQILKILKPMWNVKRETASRLRSSIERVLDWAEAEGYREGLQNPARWLGSLKTPLKASATPVKVNSFAALPFAELPDFMRELRKREGSAARALEFTILTAARTNEIIGAIWSEINLTKKLWVIPAERMKMEREHEVPLCDRAIEILKALPREDGNEHLFIGQKKGRGLSNMAMSGLMQKRMGITNATVHGFRSAFKDWAATVTAYPREVAEMALAHKISDKVEAAYLRSNLLQKRVRMIHDWAAFCDGKSFKADATVVPLRGASHE